MHKIRLRIKMRTILCLALLTAIEVEKSRGHLTIGSCDKTWYFIEKAFCDTEFVKYMNSSSNAFDECPGLYREAHKCFEQKIYDKCFENEDHSEKQNKTIEFLEVEFGNEGFFCKYGLLPSMDSVMKSVNTSICIDQKFVDNKECEKPFRDAFKEEFQNISVDFERLTKTFAAAKLCQSRVASSCQIPKNETTYHFFDSSEFNPYDPVTTKRLKKAAEKVEQGKSLNSNGATILTIAIVGLVISAIMAGAFFYSRRRDRNRAEIRRQKRMATTSGKKQQGNRDTEMQPLSRNAAVQASEEVSTA